MKLEFSGQILKKSSNIKFYENMSIGSRVVPCGRTDGHDEASRNFANGQQTAEDLTVTCSPPVRDLTWELSRINHSTTMVFPFVWLSALVSDLPIRWSILLLQTAALTTPSSFWSRYHCSCSADLLGVDGGRSDPMPFPSVHLSYRLSIHRSALAILLVYLLPASRVLVTTGCCM
jgi:hypothetical protein